jgi:hypothetical protein
MKTANARYHFFRLKAQVAFEVWKLRDLGKDQRAMGFYSDFIGIMNGDFIFWLAVYLPTPLKNDGVRQLG